MRRITTELSIMAVAAAIIAGLILIAGSAIGSAAQTIVESYIARPSLCTASYCEPSEIVPTTATPDGPAIEATATGDQPRR